MPSPTIGDKLPDFTCASSEGGVFSLSPSSTPFTVIFIYPRDNTPGCTRENQDFRELLPQFQALGASVYGLSRDSLKSHERFASKYDLNFPLLSDEDETVCNLFDVMRDKNMYGKKVRGIERSTFVVDGTGTIVLAWRKVNVDGHAQQVLDALHALTSAD